MRVTKSSLLPFFKFASPIIAALAYAYLPLAFGYEHATELISLLSAYMVPPLGKESIIPLGISLKINPVLMVVSVVVIDVLACVFVFWNYELLKRIPRVGKILNKIETKSQYAIQKKWFAKAWWIGLLIFMVIPFQGSGASSTTIAGRILGVRWKVIIVVLAGSATSSSLIGFASEAIFTSLLP